MPQQSSGTRECDRRSRRVAFAHDAAPAIGDSRGERPAAAAVADENGETDKQNDKRVMKRKRRRRIRRRRRRREEHSALEMIRNDLRSEQINYSTTDEVL